jgi:hypothetical protein
MKPWAEYGYYFVKALSSAWSGVPPYSTKLVTNQQPDQIMKKLDKIHTIAVYLTPRMARKKRDGVLGMGISSR